jgi:hypothetical protein
MSPGQDLMIQSSMPLSQRDEPDTAMLMLTVVHRAGDAPALYEGWIRPASRVRSKVIQARAFTLGLGIKTEFMR